MSKASSRSIAAQINYEVVYKNQNLTDVFSQRLIHKNQPIEQASAIKSLCFTTIRHYLSLQDRWMQALSKRPKDKLLRVILSQSCAEFYHLHKPQAVVVNEAVNTAKKLKK